VAGPLVMRSEATASSWSASSTISARPSPLSFSTASASARPSIQPWPGGTERMNSTRSCAVSAAPPAGKAAAMAQPQHASASTANAPGNRPPPGAARCGEVGSRTTAHPAAAWRTSTPRVW
jgi:hypothetical protein